MVQVHDLVFCLNATNIAGQGANALNVLSAMNPEYIPGLFSFSTVITFLGIDTSVEHSIRLVFADAEEQAVGILDGQLPVMEDTSNLENDYKGINLTVDWNNVNLKRDGLYKLSVYVDQVLISDKQIYIKGKNQQ